MTVAHIIPRLGRQKPKLQAGDRQEPFVILITAWSLGFRTQGLGWGPNDKDYSALVGVPYLEKLPYFLHSLMDIGFLMRDY